jgi:hypothetical protein
MKPTDIFLNISHPLGCFNPLENLEYHPIILPNGFIKPTDKGSKRHPLGCFNLLEKFRLDFKRFFGYFIINLKPTGGRQPSASSAC